MYIEKELHRVQWPADAAGDGRAADQIKVKDGCRERERERTVPGLVAGRRRRRWSVEEEPWFPGARKWNSKDRKDRKKAPILDRPIRWVLAYNLNRKVRANLEGFAGFVQPAGSTATALLLLGNQESHIPEASSENRELC